MSGLRERAGDLVEAWPPGGLVVGLLTDPADPGWAGSAVLALALATAERRRPALLVDLAPERTDLASRFDAADRPGFAELVDGEVELWEIVHRHHGGDAFYVPCGLGTPGAQLARSPGAASLAERVRSRGRIMLVPMDRRGAGEAAADGWIDGFVQVGEKGVSSARLTGDARMLGHLERRADTPRRERAAGEPPPGRPRRDRSTPRMDLRRRRRSGGLVRRVARTIVTAALIVAAGVTASSWLGGPGWDEVRSAAGLVTGEVGRSVSAGPGAASDSTSGDRAAPATPTTSDSVAPSADDTSGAGSPPSEQR